MAESLYKPTVAFARQRPVIVGDVIVADTVQRKSSQKIACKPSTKWEEYTLDYIFPTDTTQNEIFQAVISPLVRHTQNGNTSLAVLYGPTGSGKTYTLLGEEPTDMINYHHSYIGQLPRALMSIFQYLNLQNLDYDVSMSFFEVYDDRCRDLLAKVDAWGDDEDKKEFNCLDDLMEAPVTSYHGFKKWLSLAQADQTSANFYRSSLEVSNVYIINITKVSNPETKIEQMGKLIFVELACGDFFHAFNDMEQFKNQLVGTRRTFYVLNKVIQALNAKEETVPYMESKLTRILRNIVNPSCQIAVIATISPSSTALQETANTLDCVQKLRMENCKKSQPNRHSLSLLDPALELGIMVLKAEQMRENISKIIVQEVVNYKAPVCLINNVDDLYDQIKLMEIECLNLNRNYGELLENISTALSSSAKLRNCEDPVAIELMYKQRKIQRILDPLRKWISKISYFVTAYKITSDVHDFKLRFHLEKCNDRPSRFFPFNTPRPRLIEETQISEKPVESPRIDLGVKVVTSTKSNRRQRRYKKAFPKKQVPLIENEQEEDVEGQETQSESSASRPPSVISKSVSEVSSANSSATRDVTPFQPKPKKRSPLADTISSSGSTVESLEKNVQSVISILENVREQLEKLKK